MKITRSLDDRPTALGVHIYAGGFSIGVRDAGFRILAHLEEWPFGVETSRNNLGVKVYQGLPSWDEAVLRYAGKVRWLYGNPPCAAWSIAGHHPVGDRAGLAEGTQLADADRWQDDARVDCTRRLFALIPRIRPEVFTWESVAAAHKQGAEFVHEQTAQLIGRGYRVYHVLLDGHDAGLAQHRKRFFFLASKWRIRFERPALGGRVMRDALEPVLSGRMEPGRGATTNETYTALLKRMPKNIRKKLREQFDEDLGDREPELNAHGQVKGRPSFLQWRLCFDEVSPTVVGNPHYFHPVKPRHLSVLEQQLLCGYPEDYEFAGSTAQAYPQIGKAVLPPVSRWLAKQVRKAIDAKELSKPGLTTFDFIH